MILKKFYRSLKNIWIKFCFFSSIFYFLFPVIGYAQKPIFSIGVVGGLNTSQVSGDDLWGFNQFGTYGGLTLNAQVNEKKSFQFHIAYSQKGSRMPSNTQGAVYVLRLNYIDVPVIYSYRFQKKKFRNVHGELGVINSYLVNYNERNIFGEIAPTRPFKKYEASMMIGLSYWIKHGFYFSIRFVNSVLPIREHLSNATYRFNRGQYNTIVQFSLNYFFKKKAT